MTDETSAERTSANDNNSANDNSAKDIYGDGEVPGDADLNAPGAKNETAADDAVTDIAESLKLDDDGQLPPGAPLP
jgi:hypothetical protein